MEPLEIANQKIYFKSSERMEEIESETITLIITSPPYWNVRNYGEIDQIGFGQSYFQYIESLNRVWSRIQIVVQKIGVLFF